MNEKEKTPFRRLISTDKENLKGKTNRHWRKLIYSIHKYNPSTIFLTQGSTIPYGRVFKEAYKNAFPNEKQPNFLTINVKRMRELEHSDDYMDEVGKEFRKVDKFAKIGYQRFWDFEHKYIAKDPLVAKEINSIKNKCDKYVKDQGKILILDEDAINNETTGEPSSDAWVNKARNAGLRGKEYFSRTLANSYGLIEGAVNNLNKKNVEIKVQCLYMEKLLPGVSPWVSKPGNWAYGEIDDEELHRLNPNWIYYSGEGVLRPRNKEERAIVKENIVYLKNYGKEIGESYKKRLGNEKKQKRLALLFSKNNYSKENESNKAYLRRVENNIVYLKGLEGKLGAVIGIAGLGSALIFLSSNLTGNVIGSLNRSSLNFIGIGLFLVGIVGAFFYFKKKK